MENASKALIMACGVLIGILLISLAVYLFVDFGTTAAKVNEKNAQQQIVEFNSKFTSYEGYRDETEGWKINIYDIISLASYVKTYNQDNNLTGLEEIKVCIGGQNVNNENYNELIDKYVDSNGNFKKFQCSTIQYNKNTGKVNFINFTPIT